ncbi:MAG TPA: hypothetical protein VF459_02675 [Caulobacteraceae bacterium]
MSKSLILLSLAGTLLAPGAGLAQAAGQTPDRHEGVFQFSPLPRGYCANRQRQGFKPESVPARLQRLGDLPPAYVIRLLAGTPPPYDPCATAGPALVRVK